MSDLAIGVCGFGVLLIFIALRVPIGVSMLAVGTVGYLSIAGTTAAAELSQDRDVLAIHRRPTFRSSRCS